MKNEKIVILSPTEPEIAPFRYGAADGPEIRLDYLFGFPAGKWRLESTRVVPSEFSDHRAVVSVVTPVR